MKKLLLYLLFSSFFYSPQSQNLPTLLKGYVYEKPGPGMPTPLAGARIQWLNSDTGAISDENGFFTIKLPSSLPAYLVTSFIGYHNDTLKVFSPKNVTIILRRPLEVAAVEVFSQVKATSISHLSTQKVEILSEKEFLKAACCNLSESFINNATVDVSYADPITGVKEVQMLGLSGVYTQILTENLPLIRGIGRTYGLNYIPGVWLNAVQVSKGAGSATNFYESITGQINIQLKQPETMEKFLLNFYSNTMGRMEGNILFKYQPHKRINSAHFFHVSGLSTSNDNNKDNFLDTPKYTQYNFLSRWSFALPTGWEGKYGIHIVWDNILSGEKDFIEKMHKGTFQKYGVKIQTQRIELFAKTGYVFPNKPHQSIGTQIFGTYHQQNSYFGRRYYNALQTNFNINLLFSTPIINPNHTITAGFSLLADNYTEQITFTPLDTHLHTLVLARQERVPGIFLEYTLKPSEKLSCVTSMRLDHHNLFQWLFAPRLHIKYNFTPQSTLRLAAGRGYRVANIFADNINALTSSRRLIISENLFPEKGWNIGANFTQSVKIARKEWIFTIDLYRTQFEAQVIADLDQERTAIHFYNLKGSSFANTAQLEAILEPLTNLELKLAWKWYDVKSTFHGQLLERPLVAKHRALFNVAYAIKSWKFDFTVHWYGPQRLPNSLNIPTIYQRPPYSPSYYTLYAQINYAYKDWEFYIGGENLNNFTLAEPIVAANAPFSLFFDTSYVWGPIMGRIIYLGFRYVLKDKTICTNQ
ncbi:MAG: TonB-dependent receptor [Bacteroidia bacterium]|nr:TonB-dependent receptor [Bacteroidia bacterium]MDW8157873.1 TonB-dependent receptor [Bacteroidia bacterium]